MSLFKARDWWSTWCGGAEEEFDHGCLCVANIDNDDGIDVVIVGSLNGVLRIFTPKKEGFKPGDLMLELQLNYPILQLEVGRFVSGVNKPHLCILHPRKLSVYSVTAVAGSVEHGYHYTINLMYEHKLEHSAANMICGAFGGVKGKDFVCVQSMDGLLTFYEQEIFSLQAFLPDFLLPGPFVYVSETDSFLVATSARNLEAYKYHAIATSSIIGNSSGKKLVADWSKSLGEHLMDIQIIESSPPVIQLLGERSLFAINSGGEILTMKKLEYNPSCLLSYKTDDSSDVVTSIVGSHSKSLQIYQGTQLIWSAQLPHVPVACKVGSFLDLKGVLVTLDEYGHLYCSYLGTDPELFVAPYVENRMSNFVDLEKELKQLNSFIKQHESGEAVTSRKEIQESLTLEIVVPDTLDKVPKANEDEDGEEYLPQCSITVKIVLRCNTIKPIENVSVLCSPKFPLVCSNSQTLLPIVGDKGPTSSFDVAFHATGEAVPIDLRVPVTATYSTDADAPRVIQTSFDLPFPLVCCGAAPVKQANYKVTIDTNKGPVNLAEIFHDMVCDVVIPVPVLGIQYHGGPVVTILSSKQSNRYRIQSDLFEAMWLVIKELLNRLEEHFDKIADGAKFRCSFQGPIPLPDYFELIDNHFEQRLCLENYEKVLSQKANQFRVIQKRLLTRFKDKTPSPLCHLDTLLDGTYKQLLALGEEFENTQAALVHSGNALAGGTHLVNLLIKLCVGMSDKDYEVLQSCLPAVINDSTELGWEEIVTNNISYFLRTSLAKSTKEQNTVLPTLKMDRDTTKLKKQLALMCERLNKGASLTGSSSAKGDETLITKQRLSTLPEDFEGGNELGRRYTEMDEKLTDAIRAAMDSVKLLSD